MEHKHLEAFGSKRDQANREHAEHLVRLADDLSPPDGALIKAVYAHGVKPSMLAAACGVKPQALYERLGQLERRLNRPEVRIMLSVQDDIPPDARELVRAHFLDRVSAPELAKRHDCPADFVYRVLKKYRDFFERQVNKSKPA